MWGLLEWHSSTQVADTNSLPDSNTLVAQCYQAQSTIGWNSFLLGFATTHWAALQQAYFTQLESRRTGHRWACNLFKQLNHIAWQMWRHRCDAQQQPNSITQLDKHCQINALIQEEYDRRTLGWRHRDRRWFTWPLPILTKEALPYKSEWLKSVTITREWHVRQQYTPHEQEQQIMRQFFLPYSGTTSTIRASIHHLHIGIYFTKYP